MRDLANTMDAHGYGTCADMIRSRLVERRQLKPGVVAIVGHNSGGWFVATDDVTVYVDSYPTARSQQWVHNQFATNRENFDDRREP